MFSMNLEENSQIDIDLEICYPMKRFERAHNEVYLPHPLQQKAYVIPTNALRSSSLCCTSSSGGLSSHAMPP